MLQSLRFGPVLAVLFFAAGASAQDGQFRLLHVDFGQPMEESLRSALSEQLTAASDGSWLTDVAATGQVASRYALSSGIEVAWVNTEMLRGEDAYYEMRYDDAIAVFDQEAWREAQEALGDLASNPELAETVRRGLMARARSEYYAGDLEAAGAAVDEAIALFPEWVPDTDWYQPEYVAFYVQHRGEFLQTAQPLRVRTTGSRCAVSVNGMTVGTGTSTSVSVGSREVGVVVSCNDQVSGVHRASSGEILVDPAFDQSFQVRRDRIALEPALADDLQRLAAHGRAYANVVGAERVVLAGLLPDGRLQLVDVNAADASVQGAVRASLQDDASYNLEAAAQALFLGEGLSGVAVAVADGSDWRFQESGGRAPSGGSTRVAPWIAFGVGGAGLILGVAFAIVEGGRFDDVEACRSDLDCASTPRLDELESDRQTAAVLATVGLGVAVVGAATGVILLLLQNGDEAGMASAESATDTSWIPRVDGAPAAGGGFIQLGWRF